MPWGLPNADGLPYTDLRMFGSLVVLLRNQLRAGGPRLSPAFPELDVASLETLVAALDSADDNEVLAALDVLERERKARLVPALILHHPSETVVLRALGLFARARRKHKSRTLVERLISMRQVPLFTRANAEAMIALIRSSEEVRFEPGECCGNAVIRRASGC